MASSAPEFAAALVSPSAARSSTADGLDPLVVNPGRLSILLSLAETVEADGVEFVDLRRQTHLTDGNLASHARRLADGGLIGISKTFRQGKPVTRYMLTPTGEAALAAHVRRVSGQIQRVHPTRQTPPVETPRRVHPLQPTHPVRAPVASIDHDEDWVD